MSIFASVVTVSVVDKLETKIIDREFGLKHGLLRQTLQLLSILIR